MQDFDAGAAPRIFIWAGDSPGENRRNEITTPAVSTAAVPSGVINVLTPPTAVNTRAFGMAWAYHVFS